MLDETGIALIADATTKILGAGEEPGKADAEPSKDPLRLALESFVGSIRSGTPSACGPREAFRATALALAAEAAVRAGNRAVFTPGQFELG